MSKREIGKELVEGLQEIKQHKVGKAKLRAYDVEVPDPKAIREHMGLSQSAFAGLMGVSMRTLQDWEQGRRQPTGPARSLLRVADRHPEALLG